VIDISPSLRQFFSGKLVIENGKGSKPTAAFQRAGLQAQALGKLVVTGANALVALLTETESPAVRLLRECGMSPQDAAKLVSHSAAK
jgi:ATP-dependent Clp protease ATP-binding subunit ClpA